MLACSLVALLSTLARRTASLQSPLSSTTFISPPAGIASFHLQYYNHRRSYLIGAPEPEPLFSSSHPLLDHILQARMAYKRRQQPSRKMTSSAYTQSGAITSKSNKNYTRPGVQAAAQLISLQPISNHVNKWEHASNKYNEMLKTKDGAKLVKLDKQINDLAKSWASSTNNKSRSLTKEQLLEIIIEWKFTIGKRRNALLGKLRANTAASVITATKLAFETAHSIPYNDTSNQHTTQITAAMNHICELQGVGPATASSILCLYRPDIFAFMHDEVIECLYDGKRGYTLKIYMEVNEQCRELAAELNSVASKNGGKKSVAWTPCLVGKTLWTMAAMSATGDEDGLTAIFDADEEEQDIVHCVSMEENDKLAARKSSKRAKTG